MFVQPILPTSGRRIEKMDFTIVIAVKTDVMQSLTSGWSAEEENQGARTM